MALDLHSDYLTEDLKGSASRTPIYNSTSGILLILQENLHKKEILYRDFPPEIFHASQIKLRLSIAISLQQTSVKRTQGKLQIIGSSRKRFN